VRDLAAATSEREKAQRIIRCQRELVFKPAGLIWQHNRDTITHREGQTSFFADELICKRIIDQRRLCHRADQEREQTLVRGDVVMRLRHPIPTAIGMMTGIVAMGLADLMRRRFARAGHISE